RRGGSRGKSLNDRSRQQTYRSRICRCRAPFRDVKSEHQYPCQNFSEATMMILRISLFSLLSFILGAALFAAKPAAGVMTKDAAAATQNNRTADAAAIRAHIESIFQAFLDGDVDKIYATHSEDWRGLLARARGAIKGLGGYIKGHGIDGARPRHGPNSTPSLHAATG